MKLSRLMYRILLSIFAIALVASLTADAVVAEQIVIDENSRDREVAGDFICSPCYSPILSESDAVDFAVKTLTTGELYKYFQSRGIRKLNRLSFQVDVDCDPDNTESVSLTGLSFQIHDTSKNIVTNAGFGGELLLDKSEITSFKPEAVLEIDLGYDFMQRFSPTSDDAIIINFDSHNTSVEMMPRIVLASEMSSFSTGNFARIVGFIVFWGVVFFGAHVMTRITDKTDKDSAERSSLQTAITASSAPSAKTPVTHRASALTN